MNWLKPNWPVTGNVHAAITLRQGGVSQGLFSSLNLALHVGDRTEHVIRNRQLIQQMLNLPADPIWLNQVHGKTVVKADQVVGLVAADASYTDQSGVVCAVLTADCLAILLTSVDGRQIAAIHAGWRGLLSGVISETIDKLNHLGKNELIAWLGPAIGVNCFEVDKSLTELFIQKNSHYQTAFQPKQGDKFLADIEQLARIELSLLGITQIYSSGFCTFTDQQRFFSFRRDGQCGRMATLIWRD